MMEIMETSEYELDARDKLILPERARKLMRNVEVVAETGELAVVKFAVDIGRKFDGRPISMDWVAVLPGKEFETGGDSKLQVVFVNGGEKLPGSGGVNSNVWKVGRDEWEQVNEQLNGQGRILLPEEAVASEPRATVRLVVNNKKWFSVLEFAKLDSGQKRLLMLNSRGARGEVGEINNVVVNGAGVVMINNSSIMNDAILAELPRSFPDRSGGWRDRVEEETGVPGERMRLVGAWRLREDPMFMVGETSLNTIRVEGRIPRVSTEMAIGGGLETTAIAKLIEGDMIANSHTLAAEILVGLIEGRLKVNREHGLAKSSLVLKQEVGLDGKLHWGIPRGSGGKVSMGVVGSNSGVTTLKYGVMLAEVDDLKPGVYGRGQLGSILEAVTAGVLDLDVVSLAALAQLCFKEKIVLPV